MREEVLEVTPGPLLGRCRVHEPRHSPPPPGAGAECATLECPTVRGLSGGLTMTRAPTTTPPLPLPNLDTFTSRRRTRSSIILRLNATIYRLIFAIDLEKSRKETSPPYVSLPEPPPMSESLEWVSSFVGDAPPGEVRPPPPFRLLIRPVYTLIGPC